MKKRIYFEDLKILESHLLKAISIRLFQVMWKWLRATPVQSSIIVTASNRNYDYAGKYIFN